MKPFTMTIITMFIISCGGGAYIDYTPDLSNVKDPISVIKNTIEEQPPAYASVPAKVEVSDRCITIYMVESASFLLVFKSGGSVVPTNYYFKNFGTPKLSKSRVWNVVIYDNTGYDLYYVYVNTEKEAKEFIDALSYMIKKNQVER